MEYAPQRRKICPSEMRTVFHVMGMVAIFVLVLQTLTLPIRNQLPSGKFLFHGKIGDASLYKPTIIGNIPVLNSSSLIYSFVDVDMDTVERNEGSDIMEEGTERNSERKGNERNLANEIVREDEIGDPDNIFEIDMKQKPNNEFLSEEMIDLDTSSIDDGHPRKERDREPDDHLSSISNQAREMHSKTENPVQLQSGSVISENSTISSKPLVKKMRCNMPPKTVMTISEMNQLLLRKRASSPKMKPQWSTIRDQDLVSAKSQILNAPIFRESQELYAPIYRNASMFKRSYELMERILKVYVYKEGAQPIFHQPVLTGIYASEGWFMKLMEGNQNFVVKDPTKAHLFYMPFSTRMIQHSLYVRNSHNRTNLALYLKNYANMIAAKYSFWNRTSGADHFFVGCHDWAPYETRHHMERCVKALCNADVTVGYKIGKDVSFPQTYMRSDKNPLSDIGGKHPSQRSILAFFAGNMHGYLRSILLQHWENKDPDMKIFGPMPNSVAKKMNYIQHMKSSKYCICAKGYEVNSPRVVEAIFYECVPVIISDNFVPPFFDVLNWEAFAVFVAEKDIPKLKEILCSIPQEKYLALQMGVKKVQQHFLWHRKPVKYDLFHMTLHSIWYNRLFQIKPR